MVVNFRARGISRDACKLAQTPMLIKNKKIGMLIVEFRHIKGCLWAAVQFVFYNFL